MAQVHMRVRPPESKDVGDDYVVLDLPREVATHACDQLHRTLKESEGNTIKMIFKGRILTNSGTDES